MAGAREEDAWPRAYMTDVNSLRASSAVRTAEMSARGGHILRLWARLQRESPGYIISLSNLDVEPGWLEVSCGFPVVEQYVHEVEEEIPGPAYSVTEEPYGPLIWACSYDKSFNIACPETPHFWKLGHDKLSRR